MSRSGSVLVSSEAKAVFTLHCINQADQPVLRVNLRRAQMLPFFKKHLAAEVAMEACASSHHWARKLTALGRSATTCA